MRGTNLNAIERPYDGCGKCLTVKTRAAGRPKGKPSYGFQYVRKVMGGKIDQANCIRMPPKCCGEVARRILADSDNVTCSSEAARLDRAGELPPADHLAVMHGKPAGGRPWSPQSLKSILSSEAALGDLMHRDRPVLGRRGTLFCRPSRNSVCLAGTIGCGTREVAQGPHAVKWNSGA
ncbi:hypothetical protein [Streptomyces sp. NPDC088864]|uniref:hypothetical protein n=1 Tax=Streptomyces sp. NPDC088864 TaxID=3365910 RepID=UPI00381AA6CC